MFIEKGMIISDDSCWYVVVKAKWDIEKKSLSFYCICDNANNIYNIHGSYIHSYMTIREIGNLEWKAPDRKIWLDREIPHEIIVEVLSGKHDNRFDHWDLKCKN